MSHAIVVGGLPSKVCATETLRVHGALDRDDPALPSEDPLRTYGADAAAIVALASEGAGWGDPLHPHLPYTPAEIVWSCRHEMAMSVEDALARRTRCLLLDARASAEVAPRVAATMAQELGWDEARAKREVEAFRALAAGYTLPA